MKKIISLFTAVMLLASAMTVYATGVSGKCGDNVTWSYENGILTLTGTGDTYDYSWDEDYTLNPPPWFELRESITDIKISEGITGLGRLLLVGCVNMKTVNLPSTLERIGERTFMDWIGLEEIEIPHNVTSIGDGAFEWNDVFSKITIYEGVTEFGDGVFEASNKLIVYGKNGSAAQVYALNNNIPFVEIDNSKDIVLKINSTNVTLFGTPVKNDVAPVIRNDRTMLPIRFVAENLGAAVRWDESKKEVVITKDSTDIVITIDSSIAMVNGVSIALDSPAFIENDRTFLPVRFISENLGAEVEWNGVTQTVTIRKK